MAGYDDELADWFAAHATGSAFNAHYDRPAVLDLLGGVAGRRVLDAGCGAGHLTAELVARGADVVGVDGSARLLRHARARLGPGVPLVRHDLERPLGIADGSFDDAVLALVLHHVDDRAQLLRELARVVRPGGRLVVSTPHPTADWLHGGGSYFTTERTTVRFGGRWRVPAWRMPLQDLLAELTAPGFALDRLVEPRPQPAMADVDPETHRRLLTEPAFLALRLRRDPG
ncbi:class I SAM-dependent methyltransferase [Geodermatophilus sp. SYSU D00691]